jgi:hypothetical protein
MCCEKARISSSPSSPQKVALTKLPLSPQASQDPSGSLAGCVSETAHCGFLAISELGPTLISICRGLSGLSLKKVLTVLMSS